VPAETWERERVRRAEEARQQIAQLLEQAPSRYGNLTGDKGPQSIQRFSTGDSRLFEDINRTLAQGGFDALLAHHAAQTYYGQSDGNNTELADSSAARFIVAYACAYLRGGRFLQVELNSDAIATELYEKVQAIAHEVPEPQLKEIEAAIKAALASTCAATSEQGAPCLLTQAFGSESLITRSGMSVQFAGLTVAVGQEGRLAPAFGYPPSTELGPQIVRVIVEALWDSMEPHVPAVANSTACVYGLYTGDDCLQSSKPVSGGQHSGRMDITDIDAKAARAETTATAISGVLLRGGWFFSINNEAVAKSVETFVGVTARKVTEKLEFESSAYDATRSGHSPAVWLAR
jgi:hypothetical protein